MTPVELSDPIYHDEDAARQHLEATRWPNGPQCPWCKETKTVDALGGPSMGPGWYYCTACQDKFTVRVGAVYERSHIPLHKWLLAFRLMASSKKGISAHQLHRTLNITYKSAWFLAHRIREAMRDDSPAPLGGKDQVIEADELYVGRQPYEFTNERGWHKKASGSDMTKVLTIVERRGRAKSKKIDGLRASDVQEALKSASRDSVLMTDEAHHYRRIGREFADHQTVRHILKEFARGDASTNTVEGFFSIFRRGMRGIYQHCGEQHLQRYLDEFDFRYSNRIALGVGDAERTTRAIKGAVGKRLRYRGSNRRSAA